MPSCCRVDLATRNGLLLLTKQVWMKVAWTLAGEQLATAPIFGTSEMSWCILMASHCGMQCFRCKHLASWKCTVYAHLAASFPLNSVYLLGSSATLLLATTKWFYPSTRFLDGCQEGPIIRGQTSFPTSRYPSGYYNLC